MGRPREGFVAEETPEPRPRGGSVPGLLEERGQLGGAGAEQVREGCWQEGSGGGIQWEWDSGGSCRIFFGWR